MTFNVIVFSIISSVIIYLLWIIAGLLYEIYMALSALVVLALPEDNETRKLVVKASSPLTTVPITKFKL